MFVTFFSIRNSQYLFRNINWLRVILFEVGGYQKGTIMSHDLGTVFIYIAEIHYISRLYTWIEAFNDHEKLHI